MAEELLPSIPYIPLKDARSIFNYALPFDLTGFKPDDLKQQPKTKAYLQSQNDNISPVYKYLKNMDWESEMFSTHKGQLLCQSNTLVISIKTYLDSGDFHALTSTKIYKLLREVDGVIETNKMFYYQNNQKNIRCAVFDRLRVESYLKNIIFKNTIDEVIETLEQVPLGLNIVDSEDEDNPLDI